MSETCNKTKTGSIYSEPYSRNEGFFVCDNRESMLTKGTDFRIVVPEQNEYIHNFITYINKTIFGQKTSTMVSGILEVHFSDESSPRFFTVYSRRSGALGDFFQIDQFSCHLTYIGVQNSSGLIK